MLAAFGYVYFVVFVILLGCIYLGLPVYEIYYRKKSRASLSWPQVTGTISKTKVEVHSGIYVSTTVARVIYHYEVNGVPYEGTRIGFNEVSYRDRKEAQAALDRYPVNSTVTVYFDPAKPADAILAPEYREVMRGIVFVYCALALIILILVVGKRFDLLDPPTRTAQTQIDNPPWAPPPLVKEPSEDIDFRRDRNVKAEADVVPKFEPKAAPKAEAEVAPKVEPKTAPKAEPKGDRVASIELYGALRDKKPVPVIEALLNRNPAINGASAFNVPLVAAAEGCEPEAARLLLAKGADPNAPYTKGMAATMNQPTALMAAGANGCVSVAQILLESGANPNATTAQPALVEAVEHKSEQMARLLLDHGADANSYGLAGPSPLGAAAFDGDDAMVALLLTRGAKVNQADSSGKTAIYHLLEANHSDSVNQGTVLTIARDLLKAGANPNLSPTKGGVTPLMLATQKDTGSVFRLLLENGADPKAVDGKGQTALMHAISKDNADAVDQLLARGAPVNARDRKGTTALGYTKERPNSPPMRRIIAALRNAGAIE